MYHVEGDKRTPIEPVSFFAYYGFDQDTPDIPIPENLSLLAGNADATSADDLVPGSDVTWLCQGQKFDAGGKAHSQFPQSTCSTSLQAVVFFPDCVDPNDLSRVAYSKPNGRVCPDGLSSMPQVRFSIRWDTRKAIPGGWSGEPPIELACGGSECFHGDFINGWLPEAGENMVKAIFNTREWQPVDGPNGKAKAGSICKRESRDVDPDNGTDDYEESLRMMEGGAAPAPRPVEEEPVAESTPTPEAAPVETPVEEEVEYEQPVEEPVAEAPAAEEPTAEPTPTTTPAPVETTASPEPAQPTATSPSTCARKRKARRAARALRKRNMMKQA
jgi:hypothetical protein